MAVLDDSTPVASRSVSGSCRADLRRSNAKLPCAFLLSLTLWSDWRRATVAAIGRGVVRAGRRRAKSKLRCWPSRTLTECPLAIVAVTPPVFPDRQFVVLIIEG
jgi:hypothetical protein